MGGVSDEVGGGASDVINEDREEGAEPVRFDNQTSQHKEINTK